MVFAPNGAKTMDSARVTYPVAGDAHRPQPVDPES
jgi:hypothetical protein